jgi:hypothetical protein
MDNVFQSFFLKLGRIPYYYRQRELVGKVFNKFSVLMELSRRLPDIVLIADWGAGVGDALMYGTIAHELKKISPLIIEINSGYSDLYRGNLDIDILSTSVERKKQLRNRLPKNKAISPRYWFGEGNQPDKHILKILCEQAGVLGDIDFRTYIHLTRTELEQVPHFMRDGIVIQSQGKLSWGINKNWYPDRFQKVVNYLKKSLPIVQVGTSEDPMLAGCIDMRDRTSLRFVAAILYWSRCFVGQVGGLMHLARAVDTRSVIIYGGFEEPWQSGYDFNFNITSKVDCSPCWKMTDCLPRKCMDNISAEQVIETVEILLSQECA